MVTMLPQWLYAHVMQALNNWKLRDLLRKAQYNLERQSKKNNTLSEPSSQKVLWMRLKIILIA